jgi:hypothetical protein
MPKYEKLSCVEIRKNYKKRKEQKIKMEVIIEYIFRFKPWKTGKKKQIKAM